MKAADLSPEGPTAGSGKPYSICACSAALSPHRAPAGGGFKVFCRCCGVPGQAAHGSTPKQACELWHLEREARATATNPSLADVMASQPDWVQTARPCVGCSHRNVMMAVVHDRWLVYCEFCAEQCVTKPEPSVGETADQAYDGWSARWSAPATPLTDAPPAVTLTGDPSASGDTLPCDLRIQAAALLRQARELQQSAQVLLRAAEQIECPGIHS